MYPGAMPLDTDTLTVSKNALIGLGLLALDILGSGTCVSGSACTVTSPASLGVLMGPGRIYSLQNVDATAYGSLAADNTNQIVKQGNQFGNVTLATPAPTTTGQSINYLIEATYQDSDTTPVLLPYFNASNPAQAYAGPNNSNTTQNTLRQGLLVLQAKAGTAATTGSQTTPSADSGFVGLYSVTVAYGQTTVTSGNITRLATAPIVGVTTTTAPSAGGAGALPATPAGYTTEMVPGVGIKKFAYY